LSDFFVQKYWCDCLSDQLEICTFIPYSQVLKFKELIWII